MSTATSAGWGEEFALASRLAAAASRPLARIGTLPLACQALTSADLDLLSSRSEFRGPLQRAAARRIGWTAPDREALRALAGSERGRLAVALATAERAALEGAALWVAAAALHRRVLKLAAKADRQALRVLMGDEAFRFATAEAPTLHAAMAVCDGGDELWSRVAGADPATGRQALTAFGVSLILAFCRSQHPALEALASGGGAVEAPRSVIPEPALVQFVKLLRRRRVPWPGTTD